MKKILLLVVAMLAAATSWTSAFAEGWENWTSVYAGAKVASVSCPNIAKDDLQMFIRAIENGVKNSGFDVDRLRSDAGKKFSAFIQDIPFTCATIAIQIDEYKEYTAEAKAKPKLSVDEFDKMLTGLNLSQLFGQDCGISAEDQKLMETYEVAAAVGLSGFSEKEIRLRMATSLQMIDTEKISESNVCPSLYRRLEVVKKIHTQ